MWNYRRTIRNLIAGLVVAAGICIGGYEKDISAASVYVCKTEEDFTQAVAYSNQHKDIWVSIEIDEMIPVRKEYIIEGKVRIISMDKEYHCIRRKNWKGSLFLVEGRLQLGEVSGTNEIGIDGAARQGEYGNSIVRVEDGGKFEMFTGSRIQYNYNKSDNKEVLPRGGGVLVKSGGTFIMNGGKISYCWTKNTKVLDTRIKNAGVGGGVAIEAQNQQKYGTFLMHGGIICHCASQQGGGIFSCGKLSIDGGEICKNHANKEAYSNGSVTVSYEDCVYNTGGGIKIQAFMDENTPRLYARTEIKGGNICHNDAYNGGGIRITNGAGLRIAGGSIFRNEAVKRGGGIDIGNGKYEDRGETTVKIEDGNISRCQSGTYGGALAVSDGVCQLKGIRVGNNKAIKAGNGAYLLNRGTLYMEGESSFGQEDDIYLTIDAFIRISGKILAEGRAATVSVAASQYQPGRKIAETVYTAKGSEGLYGDCKNWDNPHFVLKENQSGLSVLRPGDSVKFLQLEKETGIKLEKKDIFISREYQVAYEKNSDEDVTSMPSDIKKYWYEDLMLSDLVPESANGKFLSWNTNGTEVEKGKSYAPGSVYTENKNLLLFAIWDRGFEIVFKDPFTFYENEKVGKNQLISGILELNDKEDGKVTDKNIIADQVSIEQILYEKTKNGYQPEKQIFSNGMNKEQMNTYFMNLEKDEEVKVWVTYVVEDSAGNETKKEVPIKVLYNYPPEIVVSNLSYYDFEIKYLWKTVKKEIKNNGTVTDREDETLWKKKPEKNIIKPESLNQDDFRIPEVYEITYEAKDSLGKTAQAKSSIYVADSNPYVGNRQQCVRFINQTYLFTLSSTSPWKQNKKQYQLLINSLSSSKEDAKKTITITIP